MSETIIRPTEETLNMPDNNHILSCLSFLEKIYEQSQDKSNQERLFRINKAINSVKKYSNCQVSSFNFKPSKNTPTETNENTNLNRNSGSNTNSSQEDKNIDDILLFIEKELKENGINENDLNISNSLLSTSKKSLDSPDNIKIIDKNPSNRNYNKKRLSKLFLKIELKLKTFLQENNMKKDLIKDNKKNTDNKENTINVKNDENNKNYMLYTFGEKISKSPSKLPNVIDSFFSDKNKVNSILQKVQKQRRKSVMDFNSKFCQFSKEEKEIQYINDSDNKNQNDNDNKRKKIMPCSAKVVMRNKTTKNNTSAEVSNFFDMIDEKEEDKDDLEEINVFDKMIKEEHHNPNININKNPNNIINIENDSSIKIVSSLNNKHKFIFNNDNDHNSNNIIIDNEQNKNNSNNVPLDDDNNNCFYVSKTSIFNNENEQDSNNNNSFKNNEYDNTLLDDEILMKSSVKKEIKNSKDKEENVESDSNKSDNTSNSNSNSNCDDDEKYNIIKCINDSKKRKNEESIEEENEKTVSNFGKNNSNEKKLKYSFQREIDRANNINGFCMNSILSPLKSVNVDKNISAQRCVIEEFSKFNM